LTSLVVWLVKEFLSLVIVVSLVRIFKKARAELSTIKSLDEKIAFAVRCELHIASAVAGDHDAFEFGESEIVVVHCVILVVDCFGLPSSARR
jgi:hypothetical protein